MENHHIVTKGPLRPFPEAILMHARKANKCVTRRYNTRHKSLKQTPTLSNFLEKS